jgi:CubicO group peptidase (beta-lactamase class C family)
MERRRFIHSASLGAAGLATGAFPTLTEPEAALERAAGSTAVPSSTISADLQARLAESIAKHKVVGASAAVFRNGTLETGAAGLINVDTGVEMTRDTVMHIGSITKVFTATLVMQLVDEGLVDLDAPVKRYLSDFKVADPDATERITVKMLLNHTSGIDGLLLPGYGPDQERIVDAIARFSKLPQLFPPGTGVSYSNAAPTIAGYLAQRVTGKSWYDLMKERIYQRIGMDHAVALPEDALLYRASVGHYLDTSSGKSVRTSQMYLPFSFSPAGVTPMMSATDLVTFGRAHLKDGLAPNGTRLLSEASARRMRAETSMSLLGVGFGLAWNLYPNGIVNHGGGGPGIIGELFVHPPSQTAIAVLTNSAHGQAVIEEISEPILQEAAHLSAADLNPGNLMKGLSQQATDAPVDPAPYVGQYESIATIVRVVKHGNGLAQQMQNKFKYYETMSLEPGPLVPLRPIGGARFAAGGGVLWFFDPDANGKMRLINSGVSAYRRVS